MTTLQERLDAIRIRVSFPGGEAHAELRDRTDVVVSFADGVYDNANERQLENYLSGLYRLLFAEWVRRQKEALAATGGWIPATPSPADEQFTATRDALEVEGRSPDRRVTIRSVGMREVDVEIADGTGAALREGEFVASVRAAGSAYAADVLAKVLAAKSRAYGWDDLTPAG
jgi:hypothetical protein